jgi:ABC-2 type transport system permease protein
VLAVVVSLGFRFLYNSAAFWLVDIRGVVTLALTVSLFFSGMILPLTFFPSWLRAIAYALPFASIVQTPIDVWLGKHHGAELVGILVVQAAWALALLGLGRVTLRLGAKKLVIQGG